MSTTRIPQSKGFPLSSLFILIALCAVLAAHLNSLATAQPQSDLSDNAVLTVTLLGMLFGACFGVVIGLYHFQRARGVSLGLTTGIVLGAMCGFILAISVSQAWRTVLTSTAGAVILLSVAAFVRYMNDGDPVSSRNVYETMLARRNDEDV